MTHDAAPAPGATTLAAARRAVPRSIGALLRRRWELLGGVALLGALVLVGLLADVVAPRDPLAFDLEHRFSPPSLDFPFGTDRYGRDMLSRLIHGARVSLGVAGTSIAAAAVVGGGIGLVAGYFLGLADLVLMRFMDLFVSFPPLLLAITIAAALGPGAQNATLAIALIYTPIFARIARSSVLVEVDREYVESARSIGAGHARIMLRHVAPNAMTPMIVQISLAVAQAILIESALSYLGLGVQPPAASWGTALSDGRPFLEQSPWLSLFPVLAIASTVLILFVVGDAFRDLVDPRSR